MATTGSSSTAPILTPNVYPFPAEKNNKHADNNNYYYTRAREDINSDVQMVAEMYFDTLDRDMPRFVGQEVQSMLDAGIDAGMICAVLAYTTGAPRPSWAYARTVIEKQAMQGIRTAEQFHESIGKWRDSRSRQGSFAARPVQEQRYEQRTYDPKLNEMSEDQLAEIHQLAKE